MTKPISRRAVLVRIGVCALGTAVAGAASSSGPIDLGWHDLIPGDGVKMQVVRGIIQHGQLKRPANQPDSAAMTTQYDGKRVRLPGYIVPIEYDGVRVKVFILVPYVGACIHVPPPPANQLVLVTAEEPYESSGLFEAVTVVGEFSAAVVDTELAEIGYSMTAEDIFPYED